MENQIDLRFTKTEINTKDKTNIHRTITRDIFFHYTHPTHITIDKFWRTMFSSKVFRIIGKSYILTVKSNDNWTFLIFFAFTILFPLELNSRLYYFFLTITTDKSPAWVVCSRRLTWNSITFVFFKTNVTSNNPPTASVILTHFVQK